MLPRGPVGSSGFATIGGDAGETRFAPHFDFYGDFTLALWRVRRLWDLDPYDQVTDGGDPQGCG